MKLNPIQYKIKCDTAGCDRDAKFRLDANATGMHSGFHLCPECVRDIHRATAMPGEKKNVGH